MTENEKIIVTGFTGILLASTFSDFHEDVERRLGRSVWTHEFGTKEMGEKLKEIYREDFIKLSETKDGPIYVVSAGEFKDEMDKKGYFHTVEEAEAYELDIVEDYYTSIHRCEYLGK